MMKNNPSKTSIRIAKRLITECGIKLIHDPANYWIVRDDTARNLNFSGGLDYPIWSLWCPTGRNMPEIEEDGKLKRIEICSPDPATKIAKAKKILVERHNSFIRLYAGE